MRHVSRVTLLLLSASLLAGCGGGGPLGIFKKKDKVTVPGERVAVLVNEADIDIDPATASLPMSLPAAAVNDSWAQSGGNARKSVGHVALGQSLGVAWTVSIGKGSDKDGRLGGGPVVADGKVFTIDTQGTVRAFDAGNGGQVWSARFGEVGDNSASIYGGGVAYDGGRVYATNGLGYVAALDATNGAAVWTVKPGGPLARRTVGRRRLGLCDEPGQPDLFAQDRRRHDQLVECRRAGNRRRVRRGRAGDRPGHRGRRLLVAASSTPIATRMAARFGRTRCPAPR